jgi:cell division protein FtsZ
LKTSPVEEEITANQFSYKPAQNHYVEPKEEEVTPEFTWVNEELANNEPNALTEQNSDNTEDFLKPEVVKFDLLGEDPEGDHRDLFGSAEERMRLTEERLARIASYTSKLKKPEGLNELEKVPAYKRKSIELDDVPHSSESDASRFGLFADNEGNTGLKSDNSFLHDNVD